MISLPWSAPSRSNAERARRARRRDRSQRAVRPLERCEDRTLPSTAVGVTVGNTLIQFDTSTPGTIDSSIPITGLVGAAGETVQGLDFRPANGRLYALTTDAANLGRIYTIAPSNAAAS